MKTLAIDSLDDLPDAAEAVIDALAGRTVVAFRGEMGAGKTTLIGAILDRLGSADTVTSPTFALVNQYDTAGGRPVFHFDFYRIDRIEEAYDFGYEEYFYSGNLCLVEWLSQCAPCRSPRRGQMRGFCTRRITSESA